MLVEEVAVAPVWTEMEDHLYDRFCRRHQRFRKAMTRNTHREFRDEKFRRNVLRGEAVEAALRNMGWEVFVVLECKTHQSTKLLGRLLAFLDD